MCMHGRSMEHSTVRADALVGMHAARGCARKHACSAERAWMGLRRHACGSMHEVLRSLRSSVHSGLPALLRSHVELDVQRQGPNFSFVKRRGMTFARVMNRFDLMGSPYVGTNISRE